jgi:hypothetical protein
MKIAAKKTKIGTRLSPRRKFWKEMKSLSYVTAVPADRREKLLADLYRVAERKKWFEEWAGSERSEAAKLRAWRKFIQASQSALLHALMELSKLAPKRPVPYAIELLFDPFEFLSEIVEVAKQIVACHQHAEQLQKLLVMLINPKLRTSSERRVLKKELIPHYVFSPGEKSRNIDHWIIARAAATLDKYQNDQGKTIARYDRVISKYFEAAFGYSITDEDVRTTLRRLRAKQSAALKSDVPSVVNSRVGQIADRLLHQRSKNVRTN